MFHEVCDLKEGENAFGPCSTKVLFLKKPFGGIRKEVVLLNESKLFYPWGGFQGRSAIMVGKKRRLAVVVLVECAEELVHDQPPQRPPEFDPLPVSERQEAEDWLAQGGDALLSLADQECRERGYFPCLTDLRPRLARVRASK